MKKSIFFDHIKTASQQENISVEEMILYAKSLGYVGMDLHWTGREDIIGIHNLFEKSGIKISSVYKFCNLTEDFDERDMHIFFATLVDCGCHNAMIIPGNYSGDRAMQFEIACNNLVKVCKIAREYNVIVSVEDFDYKDAVIGNTESLQKAFENVPELCHTFDTGNYAYFGEDELEAYRLFEDKIVHVHIKDRSDKPIREGETGIVFMNNRTAYPSPIGKGFIKIRECLRQLHQSRYDGYISVEHFGAVNIKKYMKESSDYIDSVTVQ